MFQGYEKLKELVEKELQLGTKLGLIGHKGDEIFYFFEDLELFPANGVKPLLFALVDNPYGASRYATLVEEKIFGPDPGYFDYFFNFAEPAMRIFKADVEAAASRGEKLLVFATLPNVHVDRMVEQNKHLSRVGMNYDLFIRFEDKLRFSDFVRGQMGEEFWIPCVNGALGTLSYTDLVEKLGSEKLVVQQKVSGGGSGTRFILSQEQLDMWRDCWGFREEVRVSAEMNNVLESNSQAVVLKVNGEIRLYIDPPSRKHAAVSEIGGSKGKGSGNDWTHPWFIGENGELLREKYVAIMETVGYTLCGEYGYEGVFGVDLYIDPVRGTIKVGELNPRLQGTTKYQLANALLYERMPTILIDFVRVAFPDRLSELLPDPFEYNQEALTQSGGWYMKIANPYKKAKAIRVREDMSGVYRFLDGRLENVEGADSMGMVEVMRKGLVAIRGEEKGREFKGGMIPLAYCYGCGFPVFSETVPELTPQGKAVAQAVYDRFIEAVY